MMRPMSTLHLFCGLPGSGKSTLASRLERDEQGIRLSPDEWMLALGFELYDEGARERVEQLQWVLAQRMLAAGSNVILENGFWSRRERNSYRSTAVALGANARLHYLDVPVEELKRRIILRNRERPTEAQVNPTDLDEWAVLFEPPGADELNG